MGRSRKTGQLYLYRLTLRLWEGEDDDLIAFLESFPIGKRVVAVKSAMRNGQFLILEADDLPDDDDLAAFADDLLL